MISVDDFKELKYELKNAEIEKTKSEAIIEEINKTWKNEYNCNTLYEMQKLLETKNKKLLLLETKINEMHSELVKIMY